MRIDCERCGRRIGSYDLSFDHHDRFRIDEAHSERRPYRSIEMSGRHRGSMIEGRDGEGAFLHGQGAFRIECGCGHQRTIGLDALRRKALQAPDERISL